MESERKFPAPQRLTLQSPNGWPGRIEVYPFFSVSEENFSKMVDDMDSRSTHAIRSQ